MRKLTLSIASVFALAACSAPPARMAHSPPCFVVQGGGEARVQNAQEVLDRLARRIRLSPEDEALRQPKSLDQVKQILRRDIVYLFDDAAAFAKGLGTLEGRFAEATLELLLGESQLIAAQVLSLQEAWVSGDLRLARASLAGDRGGAATDRSRLLGYLVTAVEDGNRIAAALGAVAPEHLAHGAEVIRGLRTEAPREYRTFAVVAEYHRLRGEWDDFDRAMKEAETLQQGTPALRYLRGMEQLERYRRPEAGARILRDGITAHPRFVRAQAALLLMAPGPRGALRELRKLKQMSPDHYLVMLLEPALAAEQELLRMQNGADDVAP